MPLLLRWTMKPHLEVSERYRPNNVGENVVFRCGLLAFPPSLHLIFGSATETVKEAGPSSLPSVRSLPGASLDWASDLQDA